MACHVQSVGGVGSFSAGREVYRGMIEGASAYSFAYIFFLTLSSFLNIIYNSSKIILYP